MVLHIVALIALYEHFIRECVKHIPKILTDIHRNYFGIEDTALIVSTGFVCLFSLYVGLWIFCFFQIVTNNPRNNVWQEAKRPKIKMNDSGPETIYHRNFHKTTETAVKWEDCSPYYKQDFNLSVGCLTTNDGVHGTCFRVGNKRLVMTAYHVVKHVIDEAIQQIAHRIVRQQKPTASNKSDTEKAFTVQNAEDLEQNLRILLKSTAPELSFTKMLKELEVELENVFEKDVMNKIVHLLDTTLWKEAFSIKFDGMDSNLSCCYDMPFADEEHDVIVLEISEGGDLPNPVILDMKDPPELVDVIGYSTKNYLMVDMACKLYKDPDELQSDINIAIDWWNNNLDCQSDVRSVRKSLMSMTNRHILNTSESFEHGASGSPITKVDLKRKLPLVYMMYQRGYPHHHYESRQRIITPPHVRFESGITMKRVAELINKHGKEPLFIELFSVMDRR